jgi:hypothetical protein
MDLASSNPLQSAAFGAAKNGLAKTGWSQRLPPLFAVDKTFRATAPDCRLKNVRCVTFCEPLTYIYPPSTEMAVANAIFCGMITAPMFMVGF